MGRVKVIGITGGSGAGKGSVCRVLSELGAVVLDCDAIAHEVILKGGAAYEEVAAEFGGALGEDGEIDRRRLGSIVFADASLRKRLESIVHAHVAERCADVVAAQTNAAYSAVNRNDKPVIIAIDAPLLIEANMHGYCDQIWVVTAGYGARLGRVTARDNIGAEAAKIRFGAQTPAEELLLYADAVIENDGDIEELRRKVIKLVDNI